MSGHTRRSLLRALTAVPVAGFLWPAKGLAQSALPRRDLDRLRISSVSLSPAIAQLGEQVTVTVTAHNPGDTAASNIPWELTLGLRRTLKGNLTIPARSSATFSGTLSANRTPTMPISAAIDPDNTLGEPLAQRANNRVETSLVVQPATQDSWSEWSSKAVAEAQKVLEEMTQYTNIGWSTINGAELKFTLRCQAPNMDTSHLLALTQKGVPQDVARAFVESVRKAYESWVGGFQGVCPTAYPPYVAVPAPVAPPIQNIPYPLQAAGSSTFAGEFSQATLAASVKLRLGARATEAGAAPAIEAFSSAVSSHFSVLLVTKRVQNATGTGPVPTFAPPHVNSGPVTAGSVAPALRHIF